MQKIATRNKPAFLGSACESLRRYLLSSLLLMLCILESAVANPPYIAVIAHQKVDAASLSAPRLKSIFGMRTTTWKDGKQIKVFVLKDKDPLHVRFAKDVLQTYPYSLRRIWERRVYSGTGLAPTVVDSETEMLKLIAETENAIGYIQQHNIDQNVKVLEIQ